jgi:DNA polymerase-4
MWSRAIVFVDMNAFFASIEQLDYPELRGKPVAVTNGAEGTCIITCSYEARAHGIKTGMRLPEAKKLCSNLIVRPTRIKRYTELSAKIMKSLETITPDIEIFSVDEAFLDVTHCQRLWGTPEFIGRKVKKLVTDISGLPCSVGVSSDKSTAKYAGNVQKPNGFTIIPPEKIRESLEHVLVNELCGIGPGITQFLLKYGVKYCGDMQKLPISILAQRFGNLGRRIWLMAQGLDFDAVHTKYKDPKSVGHGKVMPPNTKDERTVLIYLQHMAEKVGVRLRRYNLEAKTYFIGVKSYAWGWMGERRQLSPPSNDGKKIYQLGREILREHWDGSGLFQIQITAVDPVFSHIQKELFDDLEGHGEKLNKIIDQINSKFGSNTLIPAPLLNRTKMNDVIAPAWKPEGVRKSV